MKSKRGLIGAFTVAALLVGWSAVAEAGKVEWKGSSFETDQGAYTLLGVGNRYKVGGIVNVYNAGFYVHKEKTNKSLAKMLKKKPNTFKAFMKPDGKADWEKLRNSSKFNNFIWKYAFPKKLVMKFKFNVKAKQVTDAYKSSLGKTIKDPQDPKYKDAYDTFIAGVNHPCSKGETMTVTTVGDNIKVSGPFPSFKIDDHWRFRQAIWKIWFGANPIQKPLKVNLTKYADKLTLP